MRVVRRLRTPSFVLDSIVKVIDLDQFFNWEDEASVVADAVRSQVRGVDLIVFTKRVARFLT